ncbi:MafI family immunity protein [Paenibacillus arenosi]|uniref:MafI family immunity protein n=1 Tax=Paenibacillus arenosi TaxID=2774142 RepID=A0ABR9AT07_9BACL|nr:MafI family immunity protein [Paenibacillus arenosi]MBD8497245.1 MafI family immunity protein [Paenibacillus arenosi]
MITEDRIRILMNLLIEKLKEEEIQEIYEYLNHNEWGIAYENLVSITLSRKIIINEYIFKYLIKLRNDMKIEINENEMIQLKQLINKQ